MSGWVKLYRSTAEHPLFQRRADWLGAWVWLLSNARWSDTRISVKGKTITVERGQLCYSVRYLATAWGWSKSAVDRFLTRLKTEAMIGTESGTGQLVITICNYEKYQITAEEAGTAAGTTTGTGAGRERDKYKEGKKGKKETPALAPDALQQESFEEWWQVYPKKDAKKAAARAFKTAVKKASPETLIRGARRYAEWIRTNGTETRFIAHAATWLNQERWEDWQDEGQKIAGGQDRVQERRPEAPPGFRLVAGVIVRDRRPGPGEGPEQGALPRGEERGEERGDQGAEERAHQGGGDAAAAVDLTPEDRKHYERIRTKRGAGGEQGTDRTQPARTAHAKESA